MARIRAWMAMVLAILVSSCTAGGPRDECAPLNERCDGAVIQSCQADIEMLQRGVKVYVWTDVYTCEDDEVLGPARCTETRLNNHVEANCEFDGESNERG